MKKTLLLLLVAVMFVAVTGSASAIVWVSGLSDIYAVGGQDVLIPGDEYDYINALSDPFGGTINFSNTTQRLIGNSSWTPWRPGSSEPVLMTSDAENSYYNSITLFFDGNVTAFGMYSQANLLTGGPFEVTLGLADGSELTQWVDGWDGPSFFGFTGGVGITSLTISADDGGYELGLGFGEMAMAVDTVPEPATMTLLGLGLIGIGALRRRKK